jgi:hypothetical protein
MLGQGAQAEATLLQQQTLAERQRQEAERQRGQQMLGGLLSAGGQLVGTLMPGLGTLGGAGAGMLGGAIGGAGQPAAQPTASPAARPQMAQAGQRTLGMVDSALGLQPPGGVSEEEWRRRLLGGG